MTNFGQILKKKRLEKGLSLKELANKVGVHYMTVWRYEQSIIFPSLWMIWDFADFFGCTIDELCGRTINE
jgi:transcriptional regulator with XRE-family HTH domain